MDQASLFQSTVPVFHHYLARLDAILARLSADNAAVLGGRLAPDMFTAGEQFSTAQGFVLRTVFPLIGEAIPALSTDDSTAAGLRERSAEVTGLLDGVTEEQFAGGRAAGDPPYGGPGGTRTDKRGLRHAVRPAKLLLPPLHGLRHSAATGCIPGQGRLSTAITATRRVSGSSPHRENRACRQDAARPPRFSSSTATPSPIVPITGYRRPCAVAAIGAAARSSASPTRCYGFTTPNSPRAVFVGWDTLEITTYRHEALDSYQAGREFDDELLDQLDDLPTFVAACGFAYAKAPGYEADDFLAAAVAYEERRRGIVRLASGDRDMFQLASPSTTILFPVRGGGMDLIGPAEVRARYGVEPNQVPDFIALRGDPSDNIPGAKGVGPKTAASLLQKHATLEEVLDTGRFASQADDLLLYKEIATMDTAAPIPRLPDQTPTWDDASRLGPRLGASNAWRIASPRAASIQSAVAKANQVDKQRCDPAMDRR